MKGVNLINLTLKKGRTDVYYVCSSILFTLIYIAYPLSNYSSFTTAALIRLHFTFRVPAISICLIAFGTARFTCKNALSAENIVATLTTTKRLTRRVHEYIYGNYYHNIYDY